jgi:hypothetical protein
MRSLRRPQTPPAGSPQQEKEVAVFLSEARRLLDYQWRRGDAFERKALGLLAFTGVIVALLPATTNNVLALHGGFRTAALLLGALTLMLLAASAVAAAGVLWARDSKNVNIADIRSLWAECIARSQTGEGNSDSWEATQVQRNLVEMLLHGVSEGESPVQSICDDASRRGAWFSWGVRFIVCALTLMLAVAVITILGKL